MYRRDLAFSNRVYDIHLSFERFIGIDYSGALRHRLRVSKGARVYEADDATEPQEIAPPRGSAKYWTRRGIAEWLVAKCSMQTQTLVGVDHGFSFPLQLSNATVYLLDGPYFLDDSQQHCSYRSSFGSMSMTRGLA